MPELYIPKKIKVGFIKRDDTFTGYLAYIIYYDEKNILRQESSWNNWRNHNIPAVEFDNIPQSGFIFNKGVTRSGHWGSGRSVIRVHDPREFEFEIKVDNLMGILMHSDVSKRDIMEDCIFAWHGKNLILLPVNSEDYQQSVIYTNKQSNKISTKELIAGHTYQQKKSNIPLIYIGYYNWFDFEHFYSNSSDSYSSRRSIQEHQNKGKKHIFFNGNSFVYKTVNDLSSVLNTTPVDNYAFLVDSFFQTINSQKIIGIKFTYKENETNSHSHYNLPWYIQDEKNQRIITCYIPSHSYKDYSFSEQYVQQISYTESIVLSHMEKHSYDPSIASYIADIRKHVALLPQTLPDIINYLHSENISNSFNYILANNYEVFGR